MSNYSFTIGSACVYITRDGPLIILQGRIMDINWYDEVITVDVGIQDNNNEQRIMSFSSFLRDNIRIIPSFLVEREAVIQDQSYIPSPLFYLLPNGWSVTTSLHEPVGARTENLPKETVSIGTQTEHLNGREEIKSTRIPLPKRDPFLDIGRDENEILDYNDPNSASMMMEEVEDDVEILEQEEEGTNGNVDSDTTVIVSDTIKKSFSKKR